MPKPRLNATISQTLFPAYGGKHRSIRRTVQLGSELHNDKVADFLLFAYLEENILMFLKLESSLNTPAHIWLLT